LNLVSTLIIRKNSLVSLLFWRIWVKQQDVPKAEKRTKIVLCQEMLIELPRLTSERLWVAMGRYPNLLCHNQRHIFKVYAQILATELSSPAF